MDYRCYERQPYRLLTITDTVRSTPTRLASHRLPLLLRVRAGQRRARGRPKGPPQQAPPQPPRRQERQEQQRRPRPQQQPCTACHTAHSMLTHSFDP